MAYAENTAVPVEKSLAEIISLVKRAGAQRVAQYEAPDCFTITFELEGRLIRFSVRLPALEEVPTHDARYRTLTNEQRLNRRDQKTRQRARALLLVVKAKLESVESEVETFEQAFLANIVMSDGATIYDRVAQPIALEYQTGKPNALLLAPPPGDRA